MKKIKLDVKRLHLKKEKIANLTTDTMSQIIGGDGTWMCTPQCPTWPATCYTCAGCPPTQPPPPPESDLCPTESFPACTALC